MVRPVAANIPVTLGYRQKMKSRPDYIHRGIDFGCPIGTPIYASKGGRVVHAGRGGMGPAFGIHVVLLVDGIYVIYAHLSSESVAVGQTVKTGQQLGKSGMTGNVTGPHLHYGEFTSFSYLADRKPQFIDYAVEAAVSKPPKDIKPWFNTAFLNIAGNNATLAATTIKRSKSFLDDVTAGNPAVVGLAEIRSDQIADITNAMKTRGYKKAAHSHMVAVFVREAVVVRGSSFAKYKRQGKGSVEGMLRVKLTIDGSKCQVGVTHLDYPAKSTSVRVAQMKEGVASLRRYGITSLLPDWKSRTVILADINDSTGAVVKAARAAGFVDAGAGAAIDKIFVGSRRKMRGASKHATTSDHPIVRARLGKS